MRTAHLAGLLGLCGVLVFGTPAAHAGKGGKGKPKHSWGVVGLPPGHGGIPPGQAKKLYGSFPGYGAAGYAPSPIYPGYAPGYGTPGPTYAQPAPAYGGYATEPYPTYGGGYDAVLPSPPGSLIVPYGVSPPPPPPGYDSAYPYPSPY